VVEQLAFLAREDKRIDKRSGVSQRLPISVLENVVSNAERRALGARTMRRCRACDIYAALPAITGKLELEYEGELKGGDAVARELIRTAVGKIYNEYFKTLRTCSARSANPASDATTRAIWPPASRPADRPRSTYEFGDTLNLDISATLLERHPARRRCRCR
jgi:Mg-chelatase subunit ChlI